MSQQFLDESGRFAAWQQAGDAVEMMAGVA